MKVHAVPPGAAAAPVSPVDNGDTALPRKRQSRVREVVESWLINRSDSADYSAEWKEKFSHAPTWCDADMALQQINRGKASGNKVALYARSFFQHSLFDLGCFVQRHPWITVIIGIVAYSICCYGLTRGVIIETDLVKLWVPNGGRLHDEMSFAGRMQTLAATSARVKRELKPAPPPAPAARPELPRENGLGGGFQVVIQTPAYEGENALTKEALLRHVELMKEIAGYKVEVLGEWWSLSDICFKPPGPAGGSGPLGKFMSNMLEKIIPCIWITPIDCFWEGAKPLGPDPPLMLGDDVSAFVNSLPKGNVTWKNLNPSAVVEEVSQLFDMGPIRNFFERAGIDGAYLDRWCIDPLDPECPKLAPNFFDRCEALKTFTEWNNARTAGERVQLKRRPYVESNGDGPESILADFFGKRKKRQVLEPIKPVTDAPQPTTTTKKTTEEDDYYAYEDDAEYHTENGTAGAGKKELKDIACLEYGEGLLEWMNENTGRWGEFLTDKQQPSYPDYGKVMTGGCKGFGKKIMEWPEDLIIGGVKRENGQVVGAEALQSVFLVASAGDVFLRYNSPKDVKPKLDVSRWSSGAANDVIVAWQRNFTKNLYQHKANFEVEGVRQFHPLASTSIADMLEEFSQFNYFIIIMGYILMLFYAAWTQVRIDGRWLAVKSNVFLAIIGVVWVTLSSISGLGFTTFLGINFNAATTQIVPFLSLGLGIDDMFLLLHNYDEISQTCRRNEIGVLLKETGMSVLVTSTNNILAFFSGMVLPIPALRSFCSQTAILLAFNLVFLMVLFPAYIAIDLKRRRKFKRDLGWCMPAERPEKEPIHETESVPNGFQGSSRVELASAAAGSSTRGGESAGHFDREEPWYTVGGFLKNHYIPALKKPMTKYIVIGWTILAFIFGLVGMYRSTLGLELSDVLPQSSAPAAFLRAREKYFSFYPMTAILKGDELDIPNQQLEIEQLRDDIAKSHFVVKTTSGRPQEYWMSLLRIWLISLDEAIDKAIGQGDLIAGSGEVPAGRKLSPEAAIGRAMLCSYGNVFNCTGRVGRVRLVKDGVINTEGFYNYVTGWFNVDNMMYYVSQASFIPAPPTWQLGKEDSLVPPARPLLYSQIPFYLTGLTATPVIVEMIEEIRAICEDYTERGLATFPTGIAFTFWEQYLTLRWNLLLAILIIAAAVFLVISAIIFNPYAALMVMVIVVVTTVELGGFMGLFGVKMNPISAVTLICAVGIGVEFTAHVVLAFLTALGSTDSRLQSCMQHMFVPVFHGAISTFLGIVMLVFTEFDFVFKYFFVTMSVLIALGIFNGLSLLPVLLTFIGPNPELTPLEDPIRLPAPPPLAEQRNESEQQQQLHYGGGSPRRRRGDIEMNTAGAASPAGSSASSSGLGSEDGPDHSAEDKRL